MRNSLSVASAMPFSIAAQIHRDIKEMGDGNKKGGLRRLFYSQLTNQIS
jgi:hypothetical protein